jgi:hypothetical protein
MPAWRGNPEEETIFRDDLYWALEPGEGPWRAVAQPPIPSDEAASNP